MKAKVKRGFASIILQGVIFVVLRGDNTDRFPCWPWLNRMVDCLLVTSEGGRVT